MMTAERTVSMMTLLGTAGCLALFLFASLPQKQAEGEDRLEASLAHGEQGTGLLPKSVLVSKGASFPTATRWLTRTVLGEVSVRNANGFALAYEMDEYGRPLSDFWFPFLPNLKLEGYSNVNEIRKGDLVKVTYSEMEYGTEHLLKEVDLQRKAEQGRVL